MTLLGGRWLSLCLSLVVLLSGVSTPASATPSALARLEAKEGKSSSSHIEARAPNLPAVAQARTDPPATLQLSSLKGKSSFGVAFSRVPKVELIPGDSDDGVDEDGESELMLRFSFYEPAHFPLSGFGAKGTMVDRDGNPIEIDGAVIHEGMYVLCDGEGYYKVGFNVTTVGIPVTLYLQLVVKVENEVPFTLTLPPILLRANSDGSEPVSYRVSLRGYSLAMKKKADRMQERMQMESAANRDLPPALEPPIKPKVIPEVIRRIGKARFGSVPAPTAK